MNSITTSILNSVEEMAKDELLKIIRKRAIYAIIGASTNSILIFIVGKIVDEIFKEAIEPFVDNLYIKGMVCLCKENGKLTMKRIDNAQSNDEAWNIIHSEY